MNRFAGRVALVTGAAQGQGRAAAELFVAEGGTVVIGDVVDERGRHAAQQLGSQALYVHLDVASEESWTEVAGEIEGQFGGLDVLVNNAGIATEHVALAQLSLEEYRRAIDVNQIGVFLGMRTAIPLLAARGGGAIVNIASTAGKRPRAGRFAYSATKFAVRGMTQVAAIELADLGIRVNCVLPGAVATQMIATDESDERSAVALRAYLDLVPLGRMGAVDELARLVFFLATDESSYCTGSEFVADGGFLLG